jgi:hypothetical protein
VSIDPAVLEAYLAWSGDEARRGILDHRLDNYCLDGLTVEQAIRTILDEEGIEVVPSE